MKHILGFATIFQPRWNALNCIVVIRIHLANVCTLLRLHNNTYVGGTMIAMFYYVKGRMKYINTHVLQWYSLNKRRSLKISELCQRPRRIIMVGCLLQSNHRQSRAIVKQYHTHTWFLLIYSNDRVCNGFIYPKAVDTSQKMSLTINIAKEFSIPNA